MNSAFIVELPPDESLYISGSFDGGNPSFQGELEIDGHLRKGLNLNTCIQFGIRAPTDFISSAPTRLIIDRPHTILPDFGIGPWGGFHLVSETFVEIVEDLDPNMHQFIKIDNTIDKDGNKLEKTFYIMNEINHLRATNVEKSNVEIKDMTINSSNLKESLNIQLMRIRKPFKITLRKEEIGCLNMWCGASGDIRKIFFSKKQKLQIQ